MYNEFVKFVKDLYQTNEFIPLHEPRFIGNEKEYVNECITSTFVSSVGKYVDIFEKKIEEYTGAKKAVACINGTNGLHIALQLVGVKQGDEVITQPLTFIATTNAINYCKAIPVFVDVEMNTLGLSPEALSLFLEENAKIINEECYNKKTNRRISACVPVHTFGHPCRIDEIIEICKKYNIKVVEDAAESVGSFYKGKHTGTFGDIGVFSFNGNKIITTGGGGMLMFNDKEKGEYAKHLTTQAKVPHPYEFVHDAVGYNYRMPNINAALGLAQLEEIDFFIENKRKIAENYRVFFKEKGIEFFTEPENSKSNYWLNVILLKDRAERDTFLKFTNKNGIMTRPVWKLMNRLSMYQNNFCGNLKNAEFIEDRIVNIPSSPII